jgi:phenylalanyl-tRNA synthetase beta chain
MRPSVLPNLVAAVGRNLDRGATEVGLFEVGPSYLSEKPEGQGRAAAVVRQGFASPRHWDAPRRAVDALDTKADALAVLSSCGVAAGSSSVEAGGPPWYHPGRSGTIRQGPRITLAVFGELHPKVLAELGVKGPVVACEVYLDALPLGKKKGAARPALDAPDLLTVERDFAFLVDARTAAGGVLRAAAKADKLVEGVSLFDVFEGKGVPEGQKSLAIAVRLQPRGRTLTDDEIDAACARIVKAVEKATGGSLRT